MDECAQAALEVLDAGGVAAPIVICGTSWGGFVAPRIALHAPERVRGMVLFNTSAEQALPFQKANASLLVPMLRLPLLDGITDGIIRSSMLTADTRKQRPQIGLNLSKRFRTWKRGPMIDTVRSVLLDRSSVLDALPNVSCPALVVSGAKDALLPTALSLHITEKLPTARHVEVPDAAHLIPLEAAGAANHLILSFAHSLG